MIWVAVLVVVKSIIMHAKAPGFEAPGTHIEDNLIDTSCKIEECRSPWKTIHEEEKGEPLP